MPGAWICKDHPEHGAFLQVTLEKLGPHAEVSAEINVHGRAGERAHQRLLDRRAAGEKALRRYACPVCIEIAKRTKRPHPGAWMRPATEAEAAKAA